MTNLPDSTQAYVYSIVRAMPNPRRGECVNLGVIVLAPDGHYSDARFGSLNRVRRLDSNADTDSMRSFLNGVMGALPLHGYQAHLGTKQAPMNVATLNMWSKEFGGAVRLSEPRSVLATNPSELLDQLFQDYVGPTNASLTPPALVEERTPTRAQILTSLDRAIPAWDGRPVRTAPGTTLRGRIAHHQVDRVIEVEQSVIIAVVEAISFGTRDLADVYGRRATICLASEDLRGSPDTANIAAFALHTTAPQDRLEILQESAELFRAKGVTPVLYGNLGPIRQLVEQGLLLQ
jgi:hypothetical protein